MGAHDILPGRRGGGAQPIGGWEGGDKYNLNNPKQSFTILSRVEGLTPDNLHSSTQTQHLHVLLDLIFMFQFPVHLKY